MSFRLKTILGIALIEVLLLSALIVSGLHYLKVTNEDQLLQRAETSARLFASMTADAVVANDLATLDVLVKEVMSNRGVLYVRVRHASGNVLAESGDPDILSKPFVADLSLSEADDDGRFDVAETIEVAGRKFGTVELGVDSLGVDTTVAKAMRWMLGVAGVEVLLVALFSFVLGTMLTRQLSRIQIGARQVAAGNLGYQIKVRGRDELADTASSFNVMSEALADYARELEQARADAEAGRVRAESTLADAIECLSLGVLIVDAEGEILHMNSALQDLYQAAGGSISQARNIEEIAAVTRPLIVDRVMHECEEASAEGTQRTLALVDGRRYLHTRRTTSTGGSVFVTADISAVYEAEERARALEVELMQAQKLESLGTLAGGIAHEINTPIQYIGDNLRFLEQSFNDLSAVLDSHRDLADKLAKDGLGSDTPVGAALARCNQVAVDKDLPFLLEEAPLASRQSIDGVEHVAEIVRAMKEFSHPTSKETAPVDLKRVIERAVMVCRNEWKHVAELDVRLADDLPPVLGIEGELNQVVLNLVVNAAHAIADNPDGENRIIVSTEVDGDDAVLRVRDTGIGVPAEIRDRIFEPFFTTKEVGSGTGQGLAICRDIIVNKHQGTLDFDSTPGEGTEFRVTLALAGADRADEHAEMEPAVAYGGVN